MVDVRADMLVAVKAVWWVDASVALLVETLGPLLVGVMVVVMVCSTVAM